MKTKPILPSVREVRNAGKQISNKDPGEKTRDIPHKSWDYVRVKPVNVTDRRAAF